jgi:hypothetical protein
MGFFSKDQSDAAGRKQKINSYNVLILMLLAPSSIVYGYTAAIIATTLGQFNMWALTIHI